MLHGLSTRISSYIQLCTRSETRINATHATTNAATPTATGRQTPIQVVAIRIGTTALTETLQAATKKVQVVAGKVITERLMGATDIMMKVQVVAEEGITEHTVGPTEIKMPRVMNTRGAISMMAATTPEKANSQARCA